MNPGFEGMPPSSPDRRTNGPNTNTMNKVINNLIQLQELLEARAQQKAIGETERLAELEASIGTMAKQLDTSLARTFLRLHERGHTAIVPVINGACTGCGMTLPISLRHEVHAATTLHQCPNCARYLFMQDAIAGRRPASATRGGRTPPAGVARFSAPGLMIPRLQADDRDGALAEICDVLVREGFADKEANLLEHALRREAILSTALDNGLAFPHVRGVEGGGLTLALALKPKGLRFSPNAHRLTRVIFFVVIPAAASAFYLTLLAGLTKTFGEAKNRDKLLDAETPEQLWKALCQCTRRAIL